MGRRWEAREVRRDRAGRAAERPRDGRACRSPAQAGLCGFPGQLGLRSSQNPGRLRLEVLGLRPPGRCGSAVGHPPTSQEGAVPSPSGRVQEATAGLSRCRRCVSVSPSLVPSPWEIDGTLSSGRTQEERTAQPALSLRARPAGCPAGSHAFPTRRRTPRPVPGSASPWPPSPGGRARVSPTPGARQGGSPRPQLPLGLLREAGTCSDSSSRAAWRGWRRPSSGPRFREESDGFWGEESVILTPSAC